MINIVIPMAGRGSRFEAAGFEKPKPFIDVLGQPMIMQVMKNLLVENAQFTLIAQKEHLINNYQTVGHINKIFHPNWVTIDLLTEGTAATVLFARKTVNSELPLLIANSDQIVDGGIRDMINDANRRNLHGSIMTFKCPEKDPKWSYAKTDLTGAVTEVKEKFPISDNATVGVYYYKKAKYFFESAIDMIIKNIRTNGEFYTCPTYNELIKNKYKIGIYEIDKSKMHGIGTPEDLGIYLSKIN